MGGVDRRSGYFDAGLETMSADERREHLGGVLRELVSYAYEKSPAMRRIMDEGGVAPGDIRGLDDISKIPITRKSELLERHKAEPPFGGFLAVPLGELKRIYVSPGPIFDPGYCDQDYLKSMAALFYAVGFRKGDVVQNTFAYHLTPAGHIFDDGLSALGCVVIPAGGGNSELQVEIMRRLRVTGYVGTPSFLNILAGKAEEMGLNPKRDLALEVGYCTAEVLPESLRSELQDKFGMTIRQSYGTADVGLVCYECIEAKGMHVAENAIFEIVDPETGEPLPVGQVGEVAVSVFRKAYPLIRFGTGDLSMLTDEPCPCGRTSPRMVKWMGRADQVTKVRGMFVQPAQVDQVAARFPEIARCQIVVTRESHNDVMTFLVELKGEADREGLKERLIAAIRDVIKLRADVEFVPPGAIQGDKKIVDKRKWD